MPLPRPLPVTADWFLDAFNGWPKGPHPGALELVYLSHRIGCLKPSREAFSAALDDLAVPPSEVLFLDDISSNVVAARAPGLHAEVVGDPSEARAVLRRYDILS